MLVVAPGALHENSVFDERDCPPGLGGQHDRRSCEGWLIKLIDGVRSTTPALRATPPVPGRTVQITNMRFALCEAGYGFQAILSFRGMFSQIPLPLGEGAPSSDGRPGEGYRNEDSSINLEEKYVVPLTRPAGAGHPLPLGEGFVPNTFLIWTALPNPGGELRFSNLIFVQSPFLARGNAA